MKGLLIHDFYRMKRVILTQFNILFFTFIVCLIILLGVKYGNLSPADTDGEFSRALTIIFDAAIPLFAGLSFYVLIFDKFGNDLKGWNKYMFSLPVSDKKRVGSVFVITITASFVSLAIVLAFSAAGHAVAGDLNAKALILPIVIFSLLSTFSCIMVTVLYILKSRTKTVAFGIILYFVISFGFFLLSLYDDSDELIVKAIQVIVDFFANYLWTLAIIVPAMTALTYFISLAAINKRRDKLC